MRIVIGLIVIAFFVWVVQGVATQPPPVEHPTAEDCASRSVWASPFSCPFPTAAQVEQSYVDEYEAHHEYIRGEPGMQDVRVENTVSADASCKMIGGVKPGSELARQYPDNYPIFKCRIWGTYIQGEFSITLLSRGWDRLDTFDITLGVEYENGYFGEGWEQYNDHECIYHEPSDDFCIEQILDRTE